MHMQNYSYFTLKELHQELKSLIRKKYPDRLKIMEGEMDMCAEAGDMVLDTKHPEMFSADIPLSLGFRAWWRYFWRSRLAIMAFVFIVSMVLGALTNIFEPFPKAGLFLKKGMPVIFTTVLSTIFMIQALAKRLEGHRIKVAGN